MKDLHVTFYDVFRTLLSLPSWKSESDSSVSHKPTFKAVLHGDVHGPQDQRVFKTDVSGKAPKGAVP